MVKRRILVVDDDAVTREALAEVLQDEGYEVALAADGLEAVAMLSTYQPDMVLTDLQMPGLNGMNVLTHVKNVYPTTPVIIFTAHATLDAEREARRQGAQDFLQKPLDFDDVLVRIARALTP